MISPEEKKVLEYFVKNDTEYSYKAKSDLKIEYSSVIVSRNRCPYPLKESFKNPLIWCVDSVLEQDILPEELIIINDCSDKKPIDYTPEMEELIRSKCDAEKVKFVYICNKQRENAAIARNQGAKVAKNEIIHFIDDDCILRNSTSLGAILFKYVLAKDPQCFMLNLPQNTRVSHPTSITKASLMGKIEKGFLDLTSNLTNCYPQEYLENAPTEKFEDEETVKPLAMQNFQGGNILVSKKKLLSLGGFPDYHSPISYGEETGLAIRGMKAGYHIYYFPYNNLASVHLTYGNSSGRILFYGKDWLENRVDGGLSLKQMVKESVRERYNTGMRVPRELYFYVKIRNFTILLEELKEGLGFKSWKKKSFTDFVLKNEVSFQDRKGSVDNSDTRKEIWQLAIEHAKGGDSFSGSELMEYIKKPNS